MPGEKPGVLDWYTILVRVAALAVLALHPALWIALKTEGAVNEEAQRTACLRLVLRIFTGDADECGFQFVSARTSGEYESGIRSHGGERESPRAWIATGNRLVG